MPGLVDRRGGEAGDLLGHEDALLEAAVRELQPGDDVADRPDVLEVGAAPLVGEHEAALHARRPARRTRARRSPGRGRPRPAAARPRARRRPRRSPRRRRRWSSRSGTACRCGTRSRACGTPARAPWTTPRPPAATSRGSASTMVTSAPKLRHTLANSQPITPPPSTITEAGTRSSRSASSEVMIRVAVDVEAGQGLGVGAAGEHHVVGGVRRRRPTVTSRGPVSRPAPSMTVMPRPLISPVSPLNSRCDDAVLVGVDRRPCRCRRGWP